MNRPIKYIVLLCFLIFSSSIYSQSCEDCATYNAALGCYAVAVCDDPNASNYCPADYYINSGSQFCEYAGGCFCEDALNFGSTENCIYAQGCSDPFAANYTDCSNSTIISEQCLYSGCTCTLAFNYNSTADVDDGSCIVINGGCADPEAVNYSGDECASSNFVAPDCQYENVSYDDLVWDYTNTGSNATIAFNNSVISFNGDEMPDGALLGVFFTDDGGDFACGGYQIIDNSEGNQAIAAWGSETGLDNGFAIGEEYTLFVQIYGQTFIADAVSWNTSPPFSNTYALNGFGQILSASFSGEIVGVPGCTDPTAANYDSEATLDDGSCYNLIWEYENTGGNATILINIPENITINGEAIPLCANIGVFFLNDSNQYTCGGFGEWTGQTTSIAAWGSETGMDNGFEIGESYTWFLQIGDQSYPVDSNGATMNTTAPFSDTYSLNGFASLLSANFVGDLEELIYGCDDSTACNYDESANCNDGSCSYPENLYDCEGNCNNDSDGDLICDELEIEGCLDSNACNYNPEATDEGDCYFPPLYYDCSGTCINDANENGVCDELDDPGCTDSTACNYDEDASADDGSCIFPIMWYWDSDGDGLGDDYFSMESCSQPGPEFVDNIDDPCPFDLENDADGDGVCESDEVLGCNDEVACNYNFLATEDDGSCTYPAESFLNCGGFCLNDIDGDLICDELEIPGCSDPSACNFDIEATDDDGSCYYVSIWYEDIDGDGLGDILYPAESCDQPNGFVLDNTDPCPIDPENDSDGDNVCESDEVFGCTDEIACNYNIDATEEDDSCAYVVNSCDTCENGIVVNNDIDGDGICDADEISGCTDISYVEYNPEATDDDGSCSVLSSSGCTDDEACNFIPGATEDDGSCTYPEEDYLDCEGNCNNDTDGDEICDELEIAGCTDIQACNYEDDATDDNGSCFYPSEYYLDCEGNCLNDSDGDSICDEIEVIGCTDISACNYNDDPTTDTDNSLCVFPDEIYLDCEGECLNDSDGDGVCDETEITGCVNPNACNFDENPTTDSDEDLCTYPSEDYLDCNNQCLNDSDGDGVCDEIEIEGCTDLLACNYEETNTEDDGSCVYPIEDYLDCDENCINDEDEDGICDEIEVFGCTDFTACNYDLDSTEENGSCEYPTETYLDCNGECLNDVNGDGYCDEIEVTGCTDATACNYNWYFIDDYSGNISIDSLDPEWDLYNFITNSNNDLCIFVETDELCDECDYTNGVVIDYDADNDGVCDYNEIEGCQDFEACNFNESATDDDGSCFYPDQFYLDCNGDCLNDTDGDGVCDEAEIYGCTDPEACNYNPDLGCTEDDNSCTYPSEDYLDCFGNCINDSDGDDVCDEIEVVGCQDPQACNYDPLATDTGECFYLDMEVSYVTQDISVCAADNDGFIEITINGGNPEYTVILDGQQETTQNSGVFVFENLGTGAYELQISDINGCLITETIYIDSPGPIEIDPNIINPLCFGDNNGSANPTISGGTPPYVTSWSGTPNGQNLTAGFYDFTVSDAAGCVEVFTIPIINPPLLSASLSTTDVACFGENDGQVEYTVSGGTPPYSFDWNGANPNSLGFGFYTVDITDSNGCSISQNFNIGSNSENVININPDLFEICEGDVAIIEAPSGFENYLWSNGFEGNPLETDNPGFYSVTATDENGCEITSNFIFVEELPSPPLNDILGNTDVGIYETLVYYTQPNSESTFSWVIENNSGEILSGQGTNSIEVSWDVEGIAVIYVTETNSDGCENINSLTVEVNDYTSLYENDNDFIIFPNPTTQSSSININNESGESYNLSLLDVNGKLVDSYSKILEKNFSLSCENLAKGTYFAQITSNTKSIQKLIMIK